MRASGMLRFRRLTRTHVHTLGVWKLVRMLKSMKRYHGVAYGFVTLIPAQDSRGRYNARRRVHTGHGPLIYGCWGHCCELGAIERRIVDNRRGVRRRMQRTTAYYQPRFDRPRKWTIPASLFPMRTSLFISVWYTSLLLLNKFGMAERLIELKNSLSICSKRFISHNQLASF